MKHVKKYLAVLLIALMAVSVISTAGLMTAQKADAAPSAKGTITVLYKTGTTYTWKPSQYNYHYTTTIIGTPTKSPQPKVQAWSQGGTASDAVQIKKSVKPYSAFANTFAYVGVVVTVKSPSGYTFTGNEPVTVTYNGKYTISASGPNAYASVFDETWQHIYHSVQGDQSGTAVTAVGTFGTPDAHKLYWFGSYDQTTGNYVLTLYMGVSSSVQEVSHASATVDVSSITLTFN
jgi:hypothetical protein